ncbi:MAG TPA: hypothetical protein PKO34_04500 [Smithellaceae bacterium]|nr:hypothetical protein [Smithellaceae bacterium]
MTEEKKSSNQPINLSNVLEVVDYLKAKGFKIEKSAAYQHVKEKRLQREGDGTFSLEKVEKYARQNLKRLDGSNVKKTIENMQERKYQAEVETAEYEARIKKTKAEAIEGKYILREIFEDELTAQALAFRYTIQTFVHANAEEIVGFVGGNVSRIPDLIEFMIDRVDTHFFKAADDMEARSPFSPIDLTNDADETPDDDEMDAEDAN